MRLIVKEPAEKRQRNPYGPSRRPMRDLKTTQVENMKRFQALVILVGLVAAACSPGADEATTSTTALTPTTSSSTTTTMAEAPFCPQSPFSEVGPSVQVRRAWLEACTSSVTDLLIEVRSDQWFTFANTGTDAWVVELGEYDATIPAGATLESPPAETILAAGVDYQLGVTTTVNVKDASFGPLEGAEILLQRIGSIGPGQTLGEVTANARFPVDLDESYGTFLPECTTGSFRGADGLYMLFESSGDDLRLQYTEIIKPGLATRSGIEVGSSIDEVFAAYGTQVEGRSGLGDGENEILAFVPQSDTSFGLYFFTQGEVVIAIRQGFAESVGYLEGCA